MQPSPRVADRKFHVCAKHASEWGVKVEDRKRQGRAYIPFPIVSVGWNSDVSKRSRLGYPVQAPDAID